MIYARRPVVTLPPADRLTLERWQRAGSMASGQVKRGRVLLLLEAGERVSAVARKAGMSRHHVYKWLQRYLAEGLEGLMDRRRGCHAAREEQS